MAKRGSGSARSPWRDSSKSFFELAGGIQGISVFLGVDDPRKCHECGAVNVLTFATSGEEVPAFLLSDIWDEWVSEWSEVTMKPSRSALTTGSSGGILR